MFRNKKIIWGLVLISLISSAYPADGWRGMWNLAPGEQNKHTENRIATFGDTAHAAFIKETATGYEVYYKRSTDAGFHWSTKIKIGDSNVADTGLAIAAAEGNLVIVVWVSKEPTPEGYEYSLWYNKSTTGGSQWLANPQKVLTSAQFQYSLSNSKPCMAAKGDTIFLAFHFRKPTVDSVFLRLWYNYYKEDGSGWRPVTPFYVWGYRDNKHPDHHLAICPKEDGNGYNICFASAWFDNDADWYRITFHKIKPGHRVFQVVDSTYGGTGIECNGVTVDGSSDNPGNTYDYVHVIWEWYRKHDKEYIIFHERSTDLGGTFPNDPTEISNCNSSDMKCILDTLEVITCDNSRLYHLRSTDHGQTWGSEMQLTQTTLTDDPHIAIGNTSLHISCVSDDYNPAQPTTISYLAKDNALYSGTDLASAYNWGRHLVREPSTDNLYLTFMSEFVPKSGTNHFWTYSARSTDGGDNWLPYKQIGLGRFPAISYCQTSGDPEVDYIASAYLSENGQKLFYRRYNPTNHTWSDPLEVYSIPSGNSVDAPAVTAVEDTVFIIFAENSLTESWIKCYWLKYDQSTPIDSVTIRYYSLPMLIPLHTPSIYHDGNKYLHAAWKEGNDIEYARRVWQSQSWDQYANVSNSIDLSDAPHIEVWGNLAFVVWTEHTIFGTEIYRRYKNIPTNSWSTIANISYSSNISSEYANSSSDIVVWSEDRPSNPYDIKYYSNYYGSGWINNTPDNSFFCHSVIRPWGEGVYLYTAWTEYDQSPYQILSDYRYLEPLGGDAGWYLVEVGNSEPSPFLVQREGIKEYGNHKIDYDSKELVYELSFLDPIYDYYLVAGSYHQGLTRKETWLIGDEIIGEFAFQPSELETTMVQIPYDSYKKDRKVKVVFKNVSGSFAAKAGMKLICVDHNAQGGGGQTGGKESLASSKIQITPNPTRGKLTLYFALGKPSHVKVNLFDLTGRKVATLHDDKLTGGKHSLSINVPEKLSSGVYFLIFEAEGRRTSKKVVLRR